MFVRFLLRLRQPRYVMGAALAAVYFWGMIFRHRTSRAIAGSAATGSVSELLVIICAVVALFILLGAWALPSTSPAFIFSEAEIQFLFAGPVSRRQLIAYKTLRAQVQSVFSALVFSLFVFRGSHFIGMWVAFVVLDVYTTFVAFARRAEQMRSGLPAIHRRAGTATAISYRARNPGNLE